MKNRIFCRNFVVIGFLMLNLNSYAKDKEHPYLRDGLSFSIPEGWKVISNDSIGENAYYYSAEREGKAATGLITVTWYNKVEDPEKMMFIQQQSMKAANIYRNPGIEFSSMSDDKFAGFKVKSCKYITFVKGQKLEGIIYCLNTSQKTITIFFQTGLDDKKLNQKGFELVKITFDCRD